MIPGIDEGPFLFDVGVIALAHADTPVSDKALKWVDSAIQGDIEAIVPHSAVFGAHIYLSNTYGFTNEEASRLMQNFLDSRQIHWHPSIAEDVAREALTRSGAHNTDAWDGYYAVVAEQTGANGIVTIDHDFNELVDLDTYILLDAHEHEILAEYMEQT